jgi:hypothetical protein
MLTWEVEVADRIGYVSFPLAALANVLGLQAWFEYIQLQSTQYAHPILSLIHNFTMARQKCRASIRWAHYSTKSCID